MLNLSTLWVDSTFAHKVRICAKYLGLSGSDLVARKRFQSDLRTCSLKTEERTKKPVREARRSFLRPERQPSIPPPIKRWYPHNIYKYERQRVLIYETHVLCQSGNEEAPPTLALHSHSLSRTSCI